MSLDIVTPKNLKFKEVHDIYSLLRNQAYELKARELKNSAEARAVAQMSQMLAHDIRQPFTMLDGVLSLFMSVDNAAEIKDISRQYVPQVRKALMSVDSMIADVMQVGSNKPLDKEPASIESIIESALNAIAGSMQLTWVNSGEAAVEAARQIDPHLIIMDVDFGDNGKLNGFEAVHEIRRDNGASKICIHSKHGAFDFQREAANVGSNLFLPKPMTLVHLMTIIAESLPLKNASNESTKAIESEKKRPEAFV